MKFGLGGVVGVIAFAAIGVALWGTRDGVAQQTPVVLTEIVAAPLSEAEVTLSFAPVVRRAAPAVVSIYTRTRIQRPVEPIFEMLFGRRYGAPPREETSLGSGVIVRADGVVLTNAHVIEGADEVTVALADRREFRARVLLVDERTDLAVLQIEAENLPILSFRDSDTMEVGDLVLAIGNPFGVGQTVTSGIISAQTRTTPDGGVFLQTDAAINPGNSGGALVDMSGRLVGINTMILSPSGGSNGIGFAIPADLATQALNSAERGAAKVARAWIGVEGQTVTQEIAESLALARPEGVILSSLHPRSSLRDAGLKPGDIVVSVSGDAVGDETELAYRLGIVSIGDTVPVGYIRNGERLETSVSLIAAPEQPPRNITELTGNTPLAGAVIANINPALAQERDLDAAKEGVVILGVRRGYAARFGFRSGDILREISGTKINQVDDVLLASNGRASPWQFIIERDGRLMRFAARG